MPLINNVPPLRANERARDAAGVTRLDGLTDSVGVLLSGIT